MTKFSTLKRLEKHIERFHAAFGQMDRGIKRGGLSESEEHMKKKSRLVQDEDMEEMYGGKIKGDILNHCYKCKTCGDLVNYREYKWNKDEDNDGDEDDESDSQSGDSDDQSEGGYVQSEMADEDDEVDDDSDDDRDEQSGEDDNSDDEDDDETESELDFGGPKCSGCGKSIHLDWSVLKADGNDEDDEVDDDEENEEGDDEEYAEDEDEGNEDEKDEENEDQVWKAIQVLNHIKSLNGNYQGFAQHSNSRDIHVISQCCFNLLQDNIPLPLSKKKVIKILLKPMGGRDILKLADYRETVGEKQKILAKPQIGHGIFTLLAGTILPALVSAFVK